MRLEAPVVVFGQEPDCDTGALPPSGNLYSLSEFVDQSLADDEQIIFDAGGPMAGQPDLKWCDTCSINAWRWRMDEWLYTGLFIVVLLALAALGPLLFILLANHGHYTVLHVRRSELSLIPDQILQGQRLTRFAFWAQAFAAASAVTGVVVALIYAFLTL